MEKFQAGDVVKLKSGGVKMTVSGLSTPAPEIPGVGTWGAEPFKDGFCLVWQIQGSLRQATLPGEVLELVSDAAAG